MKVREIMSPRPALIDPSTTIAEAARTMRESDLGCLLIGRDEQVFGIVTWSASVDRLSSTPSRV
jgi:CBS domain-containing protein